MQLTTPIETSALIQHSDATRDARVRSCVDIPQSDPDPSDLTRGKTDRVLSELDCNVHQAVHPRCRRLAPSKPSTHHLISLYGDRTNVPFGHGRAESEIVR